MSMGRGGNAYGYVGQLTITSSAQEVPFPSNGGALAAPNTTAGLPGKFTGMEGMVRRIWSATAFEYGYSSAVTTGNGFQVPANTIKEITTRAPIWVIGTSGTLFWEEEC